MAAADTRLEGRGGGSYSPPLPKPRTSLRFGWVGEREGGGEEAISFVLALVLDKEREAAAGGRVCQEEGMVRLARSHFVLDRRMARQQEMKNNMQDCHMAATSSHRW